MPTERWWLEDAEAKHAAAPASFFIAPAAKRTSLVPGDVVKLLFVSEPTPEGWNGERMWVEVTSSRDGIYVGTLLNTPQYVGPLRPGSVIEFESRHVAAYDWPPDQLGYDASKHAWVGKTILGEDARPLIATMRPLDEIAEDSDSGWIIGRGDEADGGPAHFAWSPIGRLTDRFPELDVVLRAGDGDWRWSPSEERYIRARCGEGWITSRGRISRAPAEVPVRALRGVGRVPGGTLTCSAWRRRSGDVSSVDRRVAGWAIRRSASGGVGVKVPAHRHNFGTSNGRIAGRIRTDVRLTQWDCRSGAGARTRGVPDRGARDH
jgi:hypothetical protein